MFLQLNEPHLLFQPNRPDLRPDLLDSRRPGAARDGIAPLLLRQNGLNMFCRLAVREA
jgi:hypothetical protein